MTPHYGADYFVAYQRDLCGVPLTDGRTLGQVRILVVTLVDLKQPCATPFYEHPPSSTPVLDFVACSWESQINRYDYLRGPKEIDEKLMCSEAPTAGTLPAIYASEAWSCDLNVEELKVKSNPMGPNYMS